MFDDVTQLVSQLSDVRLNPDQENKLFLRLEKWVNSKKWAPTETAARDQLLDQCRRLSKRVKFVLRPDQRVPITLESDPTKGSDLDAWKAYMAARHGTLMIDALPNTVVELYAATQ